MADVRLMIASRPYTVTCHDGEEAHLLRLAKMVDEMARKAAGPSSSLTEGRTLLFAALLLADQLSDAQNNARTNSVGSNGDRDIDQTSARAMKEPLADTGLSADNAKNDERSAVALEHLAARMEKLAIALEEVRAAS